jgi:hypothetical protein
MKKALIQDHECEAQATMPVGQLEKFARFLEMHPGFYPELKEENGVISGFRVGGCFLSIGEMAEFMSTQPHFAPDEAALLLTTKATRRKQMSVTGCSRSLVSLDTDEVPAKNEKR